MRKTPGTLSGTVIYRIFGYILSNHFTGQDTYYCIPTIKPFDCQWHSPYYRVPTIKPFDCQLYSTYYSIPTLKYSSYCGVPIIKSFDCQWYSPYYGIPTIKPFDTYQRVSYLLSNKQHRVFVPSIKPPKITQI